MEILRYFLIFVEIVSCFLLLVAILLQKSKGQGVGLTFGTAMGESLFGAQVTNVMVRVTVVLAVIFLITTTLLAMLGNRRVNRTLADSIVDKPMAAPAAPAPMAGETAPTMPAEGPAAPVVGGQMAPAEAAPVSAQPVVVGGNASDAPMVPIAPMAPPAEAPAAAPATP